MKQVTFIGLGAMGAPMAENIIKAGFRLKVYDLSKERCENLISHGGMPADDLRDAGSGADIVFTMLPATQDVNSVLEGKDGILHHMMSGGIVVDMSTVSPSGTDSIAEACKKYGVRFMDAPVGRQVVHAIKGESLFMVGCDDEPTFLDVKPYLDAMGTTIVRCGGIGMGTRMKVVNNMQILTIAEVTAEAILLSEKLGLKLDLVKQVNADTTATNGQMQFTFPTKVFSGDTAPGFTIELAHKDMALAMEAANELKLQLPSCESAEGVYRRVKKSPLGKKDFSALLEYWCQLNKIETPRIN